MHFLEPCEYLKILTLSLKNITNKIKYTNKYIAVRDE